MQNIRRTLLIVFIHSDLSFISHFWSKKDSNSRPHNSRAHVLNSTSPWRTNMIYYLRQRQMAQHHWANHWFVNDSWPSFRYNLPSSLAWNIRGQAVALAKCHLASMWCKTMVLGQFKIVIKLATLGRGSLINYSSAELYQIFCDWLARTDKTTML